MARCKIARPNEALVDAGNFAFRLERLRAAKPRLTDQEIEDCLRVIRELCLCRALEELSSSNPLDREAWKAIGLSGMVLEQIQSAQAHAEKMKQFSAGLDGRIEICWAGGNPLGVEYAADGK
jgi:hypothetical protein